MTDQTAELSSSECFWGDLITGSKAQLQGIGIGVGLSFPGEAGARQRKIKATDPRGFPTAVERCRWHWPADGTVVYVAKILFPGRGMPKDYATPFAPGVVKTETQWGDDFFGTAQALCDAGLLRMDQLPVAARTVRISPSGEVWTGGQRTPPLEFENAGGKVIRRAGKSTYNISVRIGHEATKARSEKDDLAKETLARLPRPTPLIASKQSLEEAERQACARREWLERVAKEGPHSEEGFRERALKNANFSIDVLWNIVFRQGVGAFALKLDEEDRDALADAFEDIRDVVRSAGVVRDLQVSAEIETHRRATTARGDASFQAFLGEVQTAGGAAAPR